MSLHVGHQGWPTQIIIAFGHPEQELPTFTFSSRSQLLSLIISGIIPVVWDSNNLR